MLNTLPVLEFKSSTFFAPILILFNNDLIAIEEALRAKIDLAPEFFKDSPLIIDLRELNKQHHDIDFSQLIVILRKVGFFPVGIRGGNEQQNKQAHTMSIPIDTVREQGASIIIGETQKPEVNPQPSPQPLERLNKGVRSRGRVRALRALRGHLRFPDPP